MGISDFYINHTFKNEDGGWTGSYVFTCFASNFTMNPAVMAFASAGESLCEGICDEGKDECGDRGELHFDVYVGIGKPVNEVVGT